MSTLYKYIKKYCNDSVEERPICAEDTTVLTALSYLNFEKVMNFNEEKTLSELLPHLDDLVKGAQLSPFVQRTYELVLNSSRFNSISVQKPYSVADTKVDCRIAAVTFKFSPTLAVVVFRGTDLSLLAWKEDIILGYHKIIPGHAESVNYLTHVIKSNPGVNVYVCGHSKGANLATYAACKIDRELAQQIIEVYDLDGPGFRFEFFNTEEYTRMQDKFTRLIPYDDIVGQCLIHNPNFRVVKTYRFFKPVQHAQFVWKFRKGKLMYVDDISSFTKRFNYYFRKLIDQTPINEIQIMAEEGFKIFEESGIYYIGDFFKPSRRKLKGLLDGYKNLAEESRQIIIHLVYQLAKVYLLAEFDILWFYKNTVNFRHKRLYKKKEPKVAKAKQIKQ